MINFLSAFIRLAKIFSFIKEKQNLCSFLITKKNHAKGGQSSKITSFCQKEAKTTPFRIRNSLVKTFSQYSESLSLRGVSRSNPNLIKFNFYNLISLINKFYTKWIATPSLAKSRQSPRSARNDKFKIYNDNKNNFAILNLVKTFLTSITFDSLSRKIKNPCLVINNLFYRRNSMKNSKKLFLIVLSVLIVAFVSCKDKTTEPTTFKVSSIAGTWSGDGVAFDISDSGNVTMTSPTSLTYQIPEADWNSEKTKYTINGDDITGGISGSSITFTSASTGTATMDGNTTPISKQ